MRKIEYAEDGVVRFKVNGIVRWLVNNDKINLNDIPVHLGEFEQEDIDEFWQMLGYSVSGYGNLSFVSKESVEKADNIAETIVNKGE